MNKNNMFTYDIITDINNQQFAIIRFANNDDDLVDCFNCTAKVLERVKDVINNVPNITISYDIDVVEYLFS